MYSDIHCTIINLFLCFQIHIDIPRTNPLIPLFQQPKVQEVGNIVDILFNCFFFIFRCTHYIVNCSFITYMLYSDRKLATNCINIILFP